MVCLLSPPIDYFDLNVRIISSNTSVGVRHKRDIDRKLDLLTPTTTASGQSQSAFNESDRYFSSSSLLASHIIIPSHLILPLHQHLPWTRENRPVRGSTLFRTERETSRSKVASATKNPAICKHRFSIISSCSLNHQLNSHSPEKVRGIS